MTDEEVVKQDAEEIYLGNLGTIEFDIELPTQGARGTSIRWESDEERFLDAKGKVSRPAYGRGNRNVTLTAHVTRGEAEATRTFVAQVLEQASDFEIACVYPYSPSVEKGAPVHLTSRIAVKTTDGRTLSVPVTWEGGSERTFDEAGTYELEGSVDGGKAQATAVIEVLPGPATSTVSTDGQVERRERTELTALSARLAGRSAFLDAQERMHQWLLTTSPDDYLYNFRVAAGLDTRGGHALLGWDSPDGLLRGHTSGHYLSALAKCWGATGDTAIREKAEAMVEGLLACRKGLAVRGCHEGFLSAYDERQFDLLEKYVPYPKIWAPYYTLHKILAGLLDVAELCESADALDLARGIGDWTAARLGRLGREQLSQMWGIYIAGEYGGMNETMARLARLTGCERYAQCASLFDNDRLLTPLAQGVDALDGMHANQHIPQVIGLCEQYLASGDKRYLDDARLFWSFATSSHAYAIGGVGESEMFHAPGHISSLLTASTCESCASYNMLKLTAKLHGIEPSATKMAYYERTLLNHTLATTDKRATGGTTYFISMTPKSLRDIDLDENSCCHGTGMEQPSMYAGNICHWREGELPELYVDLYLASTSALPGNSGSVRIEADMEAPESATIRIQAERDLKVKLRVPTWTSAPMTAALDGSRVPSVEKDGYLNLPLTAGSHAIDLALPCSLRIEEAPDDKNRYVLFYGPYALAALTDSAEVLELPTNEAVTLEKSNGLEFKHVATGIHFVPFYKVDVEEYQLYLMKSQSNLVSRL